MRIFARVPLLKKPAVSRGWLLVLSGLLWSCAGLVLLRFAVGWLRPVAPAATLAAVAAGLLLGAAIGGFGFSRVARANIGRIFSMPPRSCLFGFQRWQSYLLVAFMMSLGIFLRHTGFVPRILLAVGYLGIGTALLGGSVLYFRALWQGRNG